MYFLGVSPSKTTRLIIVIKNMFTLQLLCENTYVDNNSVAGMLVTVQKTLENSST